MNATLLDPDRCYRALRARDARFDGVFFVAVTTTGIYCRPICPARPVRRDRCVFYRTAVEAEKGGFRACFRCRPELAPGAARVDARSRLVAAAVDRIEAGALDEAGLDALASELGVSARHLRRAMDDELGVSPVELAQSRRLALAKQLLQDTSTGVAEIALASGFSSLRRFNAAFRARFDRPPTAVRRAHGDPAATGEGVALTLGYRAPLDWPMLLAYLAGRATPGVEQVEGNAYRRTVRVGERTGWLAVTPAPRGNALRVVVAMPLAGGLLPVAARLRRVFDLDAEPARIGEHLARDPALAPLVARRPGLRVPGTFDPFELAVRAVLGQQVSVKGATTLAGRLAARFGDALVTPHAALARLAPTAAQLGRASDADIAAIGLPAARARTLGALGRAVAAGEVRFDARDPDRTAADLQRVPGVGPWTAQYVAMRALGDPDAFPEGDLGLRRALSADSTRDVAARAEAWRPWRAYAAMHLWMGDTP